MNNPASILAGFLGCDKLHNDEGYLQIQEGYEYFSECKKWFLKNIEFKLLDSPKAEAEARDVDESNNNYSEAQAKEEADEEAKISFYNPNNENDVYLYWLIINEYLKRNKDTYKIDVEKTELKEILKDTNDIIEYKKLASVVCNFIEKIAKVEDFYVYELLKKIVSGAKEIRGLAKVKLDDMVKYRKLVDHSYTVLSYANWKGQYMENFLIKNTFNKKTSINERIKILEKFLEELDKEYDELYKEADCKHNGKIFCTTENLVGVSPGDYLGSERGAPSFRKKGSITKRTIYDKRT